MIVPRFQDEAVHSLPAHSLPAHARSAHALSAMIVAANAASVRRLRTAIKDHHRLAVRCTARTIPEAIEQAAEHRPDVVFLDLAVAEGEGIAVARRFATEPAIVIVADRPDFAFEAFEFGAIDYLLKPIRAERVRTTLQRIDRFFSHSQGLHAGEKKATSGDRLTPGGRVPIPSSQSTRRKTTELVPVQDVIWVESLQNYSVVQLPGRDRRTLKRTLNEWAALLPEREFVRIGRSHLIQIAKLRAITSPCRNEVLISFHGVEQPLRVGRAAASKLKGIVRGSCSA